jgi:hypothetical protein
MPTLDDDLQKRQNNTLPPDIIANDRHVDDVLGNGPRSGSRIQRAGGIVIGSTLLLCGLSAANAFYQQGAKLFLTPFLVIAAGGTRVLYKALAAKKRAKPPVSDGDLR